MDPSSRPANPLPATSKQGAQTQQVGRNGSVTEPANKRRSSATTNRAEKFEDEKKRIIESCFAKSNADAPPVESYITHIRVTEDAGHPSTPPPPDSGADQKKNRVIVVAVRKSGRVRVHKARENPNGTFSIGKTWNLDDLSAIQSYAALKPSNPLEQQHKQWAANLGFLVTLGKPYYWQASTSKEKGFFIASLVKIYRKYTGGKLPDLIGFDARELETLTGDPTLQSTPESQTKSSPSKTQQSVPPPAPSAGSNRQIAPIPPRAPSREGNRATSRDEDRTTSRNGNRPAARIIGRDGIRAPSTEELQRTDSRETRKQSSREQVRQKQSQERLPTVASQLQSTRNQQQSSPHPSQSSTRAGTRSSSVARNGISSTPPPQNEGSSQRLNTPSSSDLLRNISEKEGSIASSFGTAASGKESAESNRDSLSVAEDGFPERRRPMHAQSALGLGPRSVNSEKGSKATTPLAIPSKPNSERQPQENSETGREEPPSVAAASVDHFLPPSLSEPVPNKEATSTSMKDVSSQPALNESRPTSRPTTPSTYDLVTATLPQAPAEVKADDEHRPGLGPMVKKKSTKDIASAMRKAALAANAFQPRAGGAGARLMAQKEKDASEPDGITGVVPAPLLRGLSTDSARSGSVDPISPPLEIDRSLSPIGGAPPLKAQTQRIDPEDTTKSSAPLNNVLEAPKKVEVTKVTEIPKRAETPKEPRPSSPDKARSRSPGRRRRQLQEAKVERCCNTLGINPTFMDGRGGDFLDILDEFGWDGKMVGESKTIDDLQADIRREIGRAQATGWLGHIEQQERKVEEMRDLFDKTIDECEQLDGLLTLYSHELDTLRDDVNFIEAQSQGLQVQAANQKLLQTELQNLLRILNLSENDLGDLQNADLSSLPGVQATEQTLSVLYQAMTKIDPDIRHNKKRRADASGGDHDSVGVYADTEIGQMRAVEEKRDVYRYETANFLRRLNQHMAMSFKTAGQRTVESVEKARSNIQRTSLDGRLHDASRHDLWMYNSLMLFVREVNSYEWQTMIAGYETYTKNTYQEQFRENVMAWKKTARTLTGEEQDLLFTTPEKEKMDEGITMAARKLTVKRGKTVKASGTIRQTLGDKNDGRIDAFEAFSGALEQQSKLVSEEQNFAVHFFHLNSLSNVDFTELAARRRPEQRRLPNLSTKQSYDPDREMAKLVERLMDNIYSFWPADMQNFIDWVLKNDQVQGIGVLASIERCIAVYEETNQEYLTRLLRTLHDRLVALFHRFVDEQVRGIEETKVKVKKRKGIISFMKTFPLFSASVENMLPTQTEHDSLEVRFMVNDAYNKLNKAMWECLNFIAKDDPASGPTQGAGASIAGGGDPEDKEALNYHILLIENMNHYIEEVDPRSNVILEQWRDRATHDLYTHLSQYTDAVIRRPLGKWLDFVESSEALMKAKGDSGSYNSIASKPSHSRSTAKKIIASYDLKEVRKGVDTLKKRIEKHFGDVDEPGLSHSLVLKVFDSCAARYSNAHERMKLVIDAVYEKGVDLEWRKEEVSTMFKR